MSESANSGGQSWVMVPAEDGKVEFRNLLAGDGTSLDVKNDGVDHFLRLSPTADVTGQAWTVTPWGDGTYRLTNDAVGPDKSLDVRGDTQEPCFRTGDRPGMHWVLTPFGESFPDVDRRGAGGSRSLPARQPLSVRGGFFVFWSIFTLAVLGSGLWMLHSGLRFRDSHREAQATVVATSTVHPRTGKETAFAARLRYEVDGHTYEIPAPPEAGTKDHRKYRERFRDGRQETVWYPSDRPQDADLDGDRGILLGGIVFTGAGALFGVCGLLAFAAKYFQTG